MKGRYTGKKLLNLNTHTLIPHLSVFFKCVKSTYNVDNTLRRFFSAAFVAAPFNKQKNTSDFFFYKMPTIAEVVF